MPLKWHCDPIPNLAGVARKHLAHQTQTLEALIAARNQARSTEHSAAESPLKARALDALDGAGPLLGGALCRLFAVAEAQPRSQDRPGHERAQ